MSTCFLRSQLFLTGLLSVVLWGVRPATGMAQRLTLYTPYPKITVPPGENVDFSVDLINNTASVKTAVLHVSGLPDDWTTELKSGGLNVEQIAVLPREKKNVSFTVQVPGKVDKGTYH